MWRNPQSLMLTKMKFQHSWAYLDNLQFLELAIAQYAIKTTEIPHLCKIWNIYAVLQDGQIRG
ncbi:hypothetical protein GCM10023095_29020 [Pseudaeromonas paramecii]|uniref:Uncharacterized protein n=1 Tax=Pseudaeromonas paramecii TaxID=2138166 RepID=A0ABP8QJF9_9GAMM